MKVAERCESELDEERHAYIDGCPREWDALPEPDGPITVGIDRGCKRTGRSASFPTERLPYASFSSL